MEQHRFSQRILHRGIEKTTGGAHTTGEHGVVRAGISVRGETTDVMLGHGMALVVEVGIAEMMKKRKRCDHMHQKTAMHQGRGETELWFGTSTGGSPIVVLLLLKGWEINGGCYGTWRYVV